MSSQEQENHNFNWENLFKDKSGKESLKRVLGCIGFFIFAIKGLFMTLGYLDPNLSNIVITGLTGSLAAIGAGTLTNHG